MKRVIFSSFGVALGVLLGYGLTSAADVPNAISSAGPAVTAYNDTIIVAWAGASGESSHHVYYSAFNGSTWTAQARVPGASTTRAPSLATVGEDVYLATTPPGADDHIHVYQSTTGVFDDAYTRLCDETTCARTQATPALAPAGSILYAAWTTADGAIMYAEYSANRCPIGSPSCPPPSWKISPVAVPNAVANPTTGPSLTLYDGVLYLAWVTPSGAVETESASLPLTAASWSTAPVVVPNATSNVAPSLGVLTDIKGSDGKTLYAAWTTSASGIEFARWDGAASVWVPEPSPFPPLPTPATSYSPALNSFEYCVPGANECYESSELLVTLNKDLHDGGDGHSGRVADEPHLHKILTGP
jgi:hypothetical protein